MCVRAQSVCDKAFFLSSKGEKCTLHQPVPMAIIKT